MIEMTILEMVLKAFGCVMVGAVIGLVAAALCVANPMAELREELARHKRDSKNWHDFWVKVNNTLDSYRNQAKKLKVCINGKGGNRTWMTAHDAIMAKLKEADHA